MTDPKAPRPGSAAPFPLPRRRPAGAVAASLAIALIVGWLGGGLPIPPVSAGEGSYRKCTQPTQLCLNQMVAKLKGRGWLGVEYDDEQKVVKITRVVPGSPAEKAGFKVGDTLISVNGAKYADNTESRCATCEATKDSWKPGRKIRYVVSRGDKRVTLTPTLAPLPPDIMAQMVGMHMLEHVQPVTDSP